MQLSFSICDLKNSNRKKRNRRSINEINVHYNCPKCDKAYGNECSLRHHIKAKHEDYLLEYELENIKKKTNNNK